MVSLKQTSLKYHGRKAETYDEIRTKQKRWHVENETVARMLPLDTHSVLDMPVGTGRFLPLYVERKIGVVSGIDISEEMIALARKKVPRRKPSDVIIDLSVGDAQKTKFDDRGVDVAVCVRFLDLIDEDAMRAVLIELARVTKRAIILTIRLGDAYLPKSNTAEHDRKKFNALVKRLGFAVTGTERFREGSWHILKLERRK